MDLDVLREFTSVFIYESNLDEGDKTSLLENIDVATREEMLYFLANGDVPAGQVREDLSRVEAMVEGLILTEAKAKPKAKAKAQPGRFAKYAKSAGDTAKKAWAGTKEKAGQAGAAAKKYGGKAMDFAKKHKGKIAIGAGLAAAGAGGYMAYKHHFSAAAKACKDAPNKAQCMQQHKAKAQAAKVKEMETYLEMADYTTNPDLFTSLLTKRIREEKSYL
jgi:hypothetical protein